MELLLPRFRGHQHRKIVAVDAFERGQEFFIGCLHVGS